MKTRPMVTATIEGLDRRSLLDHGAKEDVKMYKDTVFFIASIINFCKCLSSSVESIESIILLAKTTLDSS